MFASFLFVCFLFLSFGGEVASAEGRNFRWGYEWDPDVYASKDVQAVMTKEAMHLREGGWESLQVGGEYKK